MRRSILIALVFSAVFLAAPESEAQQSAPPRPSVDSSEKSAPAPAPRRTTRKRTVRRRTARVPAGSQTRPARERYLQIQQALVKAGFDPGPVDGVWGPNSEVALQDFQEAQGLEPTGRIDALSLIQLGLGPQYETSDTPSQTRKGGSGLAR